MGIFKRRTFLVFQFLYFLRTFAFFRNQSFFLKKTFFFNFRYFHSSIKRADSKPFWVTSSSSLQFFIFSAASGQLYKRVCRLVDRSVGWLVRRLADPSDLAFLASNFNISAVYGHIGLCFGYCAPVCLCYHMSRAH